MYLLIIFLPLINFFCLFIYGLSLGINGSFILTILSMGLTFLSTFFIIYEVVLCHNVTYISIKNWIAILNLDFNFLFDSLTVFMLLIIITVSLLVHIYSFEYMKGDPYIIRFISYLSLFTFFMLILVTAGNLVQMFIGWEGVGLASYLLISFWNNRLQALKSALKAMLMNRFGDFGLLLGFCVIYYEYNTFDYLLLVSLVKFYNNSIFFLFNYELTVIGLACFFIFIGAIGKSAQIGLHTWLPDAMEGPTPVSALIHAATMVTAGVFLILRISFLLEYNKNILFFISIIGVMTAIFAATVAIFQVDLKKVIAYSTCSQLGYMLFSCGLANYTVAFFHLVNHAFFKALLFLSAGVVIHAMSDEQDTRRLGGLGRLLPFTYVMVLVGSLALVGFPFLTGFYSKDYLLEMAYIKSGYMINGAFVYLLGLITAGITAFYTFKSLIIIFLSEPLNYKQNYKNIHEGSYYLLGPLFILFLGSIFFGYLAKDIFLGLGTDIWGLNFFYFYDSLILIEPELLPQSIKQLPFLFTLFGIYIAFICIKNKQIYNKYDFLFNYMIIIFFAKRWYFDMIYNKIVFFFFFISYWHFMFILERGLVEYFGPTGFIFFITNNLLVFLKKMQSGYLYHYGYYLIFGLINIIFLFVLLIGDGFFYF